MALCCKKNILAKSKEVKPGRNLAAESSKEGCGSKKGCFVSNGNNSRSSLTCNETYVQDSDIVNYKVFT
jgi:hypothetical protein